MAGIGFGTNFNNDNYKVVAGNGLGPVTRICTIAKGSAMTQAEIDGAIQALQAGVTVSSTFYPGATVAGLDGAVGDSTIHVALQGGVAPEGTAGSYYAGLTVAVVCTFAD
jgi:hypothetical protein